MINSLEQGNQSDGPRLLPDGVWYRLGKHVEYRNLAGGHKLLYWLTYVDPARGRYVLVHIETQMPYGSETVAGYLDGPGLITYGSERPMIFVRLLGSAGQVDDDDELTEHEERVVGFEGAMQVLAREQAVTRLAEGLDVPAEEFTEMGSANHWSSYRSAQVAPGQDAESIISGMTQEVDPGPDGWQPGAAVPKASPVDPDELRMLRADTPGLQHADRARVLKRIVEMRAPVTLEELFTFGGLSPQIPAVRIIDATQYLVGNGDLVQVDPRVIGGPYRYRVPGVTEVLRRSVSFWVFLVTGIVIVGMLVSVAVFGTGAG